MTADEIIQVLKLEPHPEGGYFRETFRDATEHSGRAASTAIYFLLKQGQQSHWHAVDAAEVWHYYAGDTLLLDVAPPNGAIASHRLGRDLANGERPQAVVAAGDWQRARSLGAWTLVGCTVAPGFLFNGFVMAPADFSPSG